MTLLSVVDHGAYVNRRITAWRMDMCPDGKVLEMLLGLMAHGALQPIIAGVLPLDQAETAHALLRDGGVQGKLVLQVSGGG